MLSIVAGWIAISISSLPIIIEVCAMREAPASGQLSLVARSDLVAGEP